MERSWGRRANRRRARLPRGIRLREDGGQFERGKLIIRDRPKGTVRNRYGKYRKKRHRDPEKYRQDPVRADL